MDSKRILYSQYTNPAAYPPLLHSSRILADAGWRVRFVGTGAVGANCLEMPEHENIRIRRMRFAAAGWKQKIHYVLFHFWVVCVALLWRPYWIYASDPFSCLSAFCLIRLGFHVLYHEHDSPAVIAQSRALKLVLSHRRMVARNADLCVVPNHQRAELLRSSTATSRPILEVWNCPSRNESKVNPENIKLHDQFILFYHGSIVPSRLPLSIITALARLNEKIRLHIAGYETVDHPNHLRDLQSAAAHRGISHRINVLGAIPHRAELLAQCRQSHVGLALMPMSSDEPSEATMAGASNKPFDYMACGLALLVSDLPEWRTLFVSNGFGRACKSDSPENIASEIQWLFEHPQETTSMGKKGRQRILEDWNYETQFQPVLEYMNPGALAVPANSLVP